MSLNLADLYEAVADAIPEREALVCGSTRRTYAELDQRASQLAHHLIAAGVRPGQHVGLHMRNSVEFVEALLGCLKARAVPVNINYRYSDRELTYLYTNAELVALIVDGDLALSAAVVLPGCPQLTHVLTVGASAAEFTSATAADYEASVSAQPSTRDFPPRSGDDHFIIYTGGTTGMPKGVVWRQEDFFYAALGGGNHSGDPFTDAGELAAAAAAGGGMSFLVTAPLMHGAAVYSLLSAFFMGGRQILMRQFDAMEALRLVDTEKLACIMVVGDAIARPLADAIEQHADEFDLSSLFMIGSGGALWSRSVQDQLTRLRPGIYLRDGFGASESGVDGNLSLAEDGSMRLAPNPSTAVVDEHFRPIAPGSDELGYLARSGHVPLAYFNDPEKSAATFPVVDGVRMSILGDMARVEADGSIVLLGRGSGCINTGGEKVFPEEVEQALKSHPAILDALVAGAPDPRYGERVSAVVQIRDGFEPPELSAVQTHCRDQIAGYKLPRSMVVVPTIVRSPSGKADYRWAKATVAEGS